MKLKKVKVNSGDAGCLSDMCSKQVGFDCTFEVSFIINHDEPLSEPNIKDGTGTSLESNDYKMVSKSLKTKEFSTYMNDCLIKWFCLDFNK